MVMVNIDINDLAAEITRKIRDEIAALKMIDFGEVVSVKTVTGGYQATVIQAGSETESIFFNCLGSYSPTAGDWVLMVYPNQDANPVIVGKCPV